MGYKTLEVTVISAKDLKNVNLIGKMDVYVVVYLSDEPKSKQKTPVHQDGGKNPSWNYTMRFTVDEGDAAKASKYLVFQLKHEQTFGSDKELGEVHVPIRELFDSVKGKDAGPQVVAYQVKKSSGSAKGELKFSYKFIDMEQSVYSASSYQPAQSCSSSSGSVPEAYPPPQKVPGAYPPPEYAPVGYPGVPYAAPQGYPPYGGYPPQPAGYGYGYGYPPQPAGYQPYSAAGYAKPQKPKKNNNFGMGLGAGLLGGAIGGLVLGEALDDAFDADFDF